MGEPNLRTLNRSRAKPATGDIFAMSPRVGLFLFGRVIRADLPRELAPMPGSYLVYIYRHTSTAMEPDPTDLVPAALLLPPLFINQMPWSRGYFQAVGHWPLTDGDLLPRHCFWSASRGRYFDEDFNELSRPIEPCGDWALHSYRTLDDLVSDALGIPRAPL